MAIVLNGTTGITNDGGYTGDGVVFADTTPANTLVTTNSGNVGIGTSSPSVFTGYTTVSVNNAANGGIYNILVNGTETARLQGYSGIFNVAAKGASTALTFETNGAERARIDSSGNFAVGGSTISSRSAFYNGNAARPVSIGSGNIYMQAETGGWGLNLFCLGSSGTNRGGFGFTGSSDTLSAYTVGTAAGTGVQLASGATSWTTWSDIRDKNVVGQVQNGLSTIAELEPIYFLYKNDEPTQQQRIGFSAQNVQAVIPEAVVELEKNPENPTEDSKRLALSMTDMIPVLVKAIQEQQAIITALTARVAALEGTTNV